MQLSQTDIATIRGALHNGVEQAFSDALACARMKAKLADLTREEHETLTDYIEALARMAFMVLERRNAKIQARNSRTKIPVRQQARELTAGTIMTLTGLTRAPEIDKARADFVGFVDRSGPYETWQDAWSIFWSNRITKPAA